MRRPKNWSSPQKQSQLRHHCRAWADDPGTTSVQAVATTTPSRSRPAVTALPEQKLLAPRPLFTAAREVKTVVPVSSVTPVTPPRPLTGERSGQHYG